VTQQKWLTTQDLADRFNCSPDTVLKRAKKENWPHQKIGGRMYRFTPEQVEAIEAMTEVKPSTESSQNSPLSKASQRRLAAKRLRNSQAAP